MGEPYFEPAATDILASVKFLRPAAARRAADFRPRRAAAPRAPV
ncbi:hypothetical protein [Micromonospora okii]|nr:hypothetical protein [Micromonospora okii]